MASRKTYFDSNSTDSEDSSDCSKRFSRVRRKTREPKVFTDNAIKAREVRLRKKMYMENLERELAKEKAKVKKLESMLETQTQVICKHEKDVKYLRNVLANSTEIGKLLQSINLNTCMNVGNSINRHLTSAPINHWLPDFNEPLFSDLDMSEENQIDDHSYSLPMLDVYDDKEEAPGVCLHISRNRVDLEFCSTCNDNS
ncbi:PREDICTED: CREB/ATF bZIP transcription factor-like [Nicrophorus vespilloides]|uniref:CREB/ATF bZIP transcription factor-like n=1 Tax=Nicrophorus vespilloides TaxID=110193 RepID=A0ABM1M0P6_NICVS|nr:PREDICTED: CREB/ATF bZIP transcription factor-like [Nicrophorus vespilloides]XP_017768147.1 PREDICTED: CREB/ATF bZIP transcription factor-like [Nicrophorus vespilloides]